MNTKTLRGLWSARCAERRTPGAGGDSGKPTGGNTGRAPRVDLTIVSVCTVNRRDEGGVEAGEDGVGDAVAFVLALGEALGLRVDESLEELV